MMVTNLFPRTMPASLSSYASGSPPMRVLTESSFQEKGLCCTTAKVLCSTTASVAPRPHNAYVLNSIQHCVHNRVANTPGNTSCAKHAEATEAKERPMLLQLVKNQIQLEIRTSASDPLQNQGVGAERKY